MTLMRGLFGDDELAAIMGEAAEIATILRFEVALAQAQAEAGVIPTGAARAIAEAARDIAITPEALWAAAARAGIAAQAVVGALRSACGTAAAPFVHFGATSQDAEDSALALRLRDALAVIETRMRRLDATLAEQARAQADLAIPARTRFQIAAPTTLGAKIAVWRAPLSRHLDRLAQMRPRLLNVALYGAAGTGAALGPDAARLRRDLGAALALGTPDQPWHAARDGMAELAGWLSLITGGLGKLGADLILLGQSEIGELRAGTGGGSSTMPQKSNPVEAEALVSLARMNAGAVATLHHALIHAQDRDGTALALEWMTLPEMVVRTGAALRIAQGLADTLRPDPARIAASFAADRGAMMAEAAGFHLARKMPRDRAMAIVGDALARLAHDPAATLAGALDDLAPGHDWPAILSPDRNTGAAAQQARR